MTELYSNLSKNNNKSSLLLKHNIRILKFFNNNNDHNSYNTMFQNLYIKKNNNSLISNLLNSSKKLVKNNSNYKSYTDLPKSFHHYYPYKPSHNNGNLSAKSSSYSKISLISSYSSINGNKNKKKNKNLKMYLKENIYKLNINHFNYLNYNVNESIFFDFIDGYNINSKLKEKYNNYIQNHPIDNDSDINIFQLFNMLQNFVIDYNDNNFFNENSTSKINKFKLKNNLLVKIKLSSLNVKFYKINPKSKNKSNNKDCLFVNNNNIYKLKNKNKAISKIQFPFGFLPFFYGLTNIEFLKFLIAIINYDYIKNIFVLDSKKFIKYYNLYKKDLCFFGETSFLHILCNRNKEYFIYDWDVKNKNIINHYIMKIILPQIKISISFDNKTISKFYYSIDISKMIYLIKEKFKLWDFHILKYFSQYKLFRKEINKIICNKLSYGIKVDKSKEENKSNISNSIDKNRSLNYTQKFNFNKIYTKYNALIQNENSFEFFFSQNINGKNEGYLFQLQIPKIHIIIQDPNYSIDKFFDLDIKRMSQINKLRKSFQIEDIIKYSIVFVNQKNEPKIIRKDSFFESKGYRRSIKKSSTFKSIKGSQRINLKALPSRASINNNNFPSKFKIIKTNRNHTSSKKCRYEKKDIKLNLDKYIFNFDDDILQFIRPIEENKNDKNNNLYENYIKSNNTNNINDKRKEIKENSFISSKNSKNNFGQQINKDKINVEIGRLKLIWINNDLKEYDYLLEENESQYLLDNPPNEWENYIESNLGEYTLKYNLNSSDNVV